MQAVQYERSGLGAAKSKEQRRTTAEAWGLHWSALVASRVALRGASRPARVTHPCMLKSLQHADSCLVLNLPHAPILMEAKARHITLYPNPKSSTAHLLGGLGAFAQQFIQLRVRANVHGYKVHHLSKLDVNHTLQSSTMFCSNTLFFFQYHFFGMI